MQEQTGEESPCGEEGRTIEEMLARERTFEREFNGWIAGKKREMYFVDTVEVDDIFYAMYADKQEEKNLASRGVIDCSILKPKIFYRAFLIPLVVRLTDITDLLSLRVETRGYSLEKFLL